MLKPIINHLTPHKKKIKTLRQYSKIPRKNALKSPPKTAILNLIKKSLLTLGIQIS